MLGFSTVLRAVSNLPGLQAHRDNTAMAIDYFFFIRSLSGFILRPKLTRRTPSNGSQAAQKSQLILDVRCCQRGGRSFFGI